MDLDFVSVHKHAKKELGQYPAILTSHLVNNPYLLFVNIQLLFLVDGPVTQQQEWLLPKRQVQSWMYAGC